MPTVRQWIGTLSLVTIAVRNVYIVCVIAHEIWAGKEFDRMLPLGTKWEHDSQMRSVKSRIDAGLQYTLPDSGEIDKKIRAEGNPGSYFR